MNKTKTPRPELTVRYRDVFMTVVWQDDDDCWVVQSSNTTMPIFFHVENLDSLFPVVEGTIDDVYEMLQARGETLEFRSQPSANAVAM